MSKEKLDTAWNIMSLGFNDEVDEERLAGEYLEEKYKVNSDRLMEYCNELISESHLDEEGFATVFIIGFEFGMVYEKFNNDMKLLSG